MGRWSMSEPIIYFWIGALRSISEPVIYFWIGALAGRLHVTEADLAAKSSELAGVERTLAERKAELARFMSEFDVHPEIAKVRQVHLAEMEALRADKGLLEEQLRKSKEECSRR